MNTFRNKNFIKRNYDCTNIVFCQTTGNPPNMKRTVFEGGGKSREEEYNPWILCDEDDIKEKKCEQLYIIGNVKYFGFL